MTRRSFDMTSIAIDVFKEAAENNKRVAIVGSEEGVIGRAVARLVANFGINVVMSRHGFFESDEQICEFQEELVDINPDIIVVGMGAIRQERFLIELKEKGWDGSGYTCGGFLHQTANRLEFYPKLFDRLNIRWLYRIYKDPYTLKRYLLDYPRFFFYFGEDYKAWQRKRKAGISDPTRESVY